MALKHIAGFDVSGNSTTTRFNSGRSINLGSNIDYTITPAAVVYAGVAMSWSFVDNNDRQWVAFLGDTGTVQHITVALNNNALVVRRGGPGGTLLASYPSAFFINNWYFIEISCTIDSAAGSVVVKYLGNTIINFTGNTRNGGTSTNIDRVRIGATGGATFLFDDLYVCDGTGSAPYNTFLGDVRVHSLSPTGAGSSTQWTPDTGANYARVNEVPVSSANYVQAGTTGLRDTYVMADLPASTGAILAVQNNIVAKKTDAGTIAVKPAIKSGAGVYYGAATQLGTNDMTVSDLRVIDPNTAASWTASGVNALEAGQEVA